MFQVTVEVYGLPARKERLFRQEVASARQNFRLPYGRLGGKFRLEIQVTEREAAAALGEHFEAVAEWLGAKFIKGHIAEAADWNAAPPCSTSYTDL